MNVGGSNPKRNRPDGHASGVAGTDLPATPGFIGRDRSTPAQTPIPNNSRLQKLAGTAWLGALPIA
jgi:hypothetical protein